MRLLRAIRRTLSCKRPSEATTGQYRGMKLVSVVRATAIDVSKSCMLHGQSDAVASASRARLRCHPEQLVQARRMEPPRADLDQHVSWLADCLADSLAGCVAGSLSTWLADWLAGAASLMISDAMAVNPALLAYVPGHLPDLTTKPGSPCFSGFIIMLAAHCFAVTLLASVVYSAPPHSSSSLSFIS